RLRHDGRRSLASGAHVVGHAERDDARVAARAARAAESDRNRAAPHARPAPADALRKDAGRAVASRRDRAGRGRGRDVTASAARIALASEADTDGATANTRGGSRGRDVVAAIAAAAAYRLHENAAGVLTGRRNA